MANPNKGMTTKEVKIVCMVISSSEILNIIHMMNNPDDSNKYESIKIVNSLERNIFFSFGEDDDELRESSFLLPENIAKSSPNKTTKLIMKSITAQEVNDDCIVAKVLGLFSIGHRVNTIKPMKRKAKYVIFLFKIVFTFFEIMSIIFLSPFLNIFYLNKEISTGNSSTLPSIAKVFLHIHLRYKHLHTLQHRSYHSYE